MSSESELVIPFLKHRTSLIPPFRNPTLSSLVAQVTAGSGSSSASPSGSSSDSGSSDTQDSGAILVGLSSALAVGSAAIVVFCAGVVF